MLQGKTGTQLRLKLLHNVCFWACVILTPQMSRKYSLFLFFSPWFGICGSLNAPGSCNVLRERQRALTEYFTGEKTLLLSSLSVPRASLKWPLIEIMWRKIKSQIFCAWKSWIFRVSRFPLKSQDRIHFRTHQNKPFIIKILTSFFFFFQCRFILLCSRRAVAAGISTCPGLARTPASARPAGSTRHLLSLLQAQLIPQLRATQSTRSYKNTGSCKYSSTSTFKQGKANA